MDTNNNNPSDPNTVDNQSEYQKILDKYAAELAATDISPTLDNDSSAPSPQIPVLPPQSSEAFPNVIDSSSANDPKPATEAENLLSAEPALIDIPQPSLPADLVPALPAEPDYKHPAVTTSSIQESVDPTPLARELPPQTSQTINAENTDNTLTSNISLEHKPVLPDLPPTNPEPKSIALLSPPTEPQPAISTQQLPKNQKASSLPKFFFILSLIIFLIVSAGVVFTFIKSRDLSSVVEDSLPTPTVAPTDSSSDSSSAVCLINDKTYASGESFTAADSCNTCTCLDNGTISCTEKDCSSITPSPGQAATLKLDKISPLKGKTSTIVTLSGSGFGTGENTVVFASADTTTNTCSYSYSDLISKDNKTITLTIDQDEFTANCPSNIASPTPSAKMLPGKYTVSVKVGESSSYNKASLVTFTLE